MKILNYCFTLFLIFAFCSGIYVIMNDTFKIEPMTDGSPYFCPDTLVEKNGLIILYNSDFPDDHITFNNLEEYNIFIKTQIENGIKCPKLDLQVIKENNYEPTYIIDSSDDNLPFNKEQYPSFDPYGLQIGTYTELDKIHDSFNYKKLPNESKYWQDIETTSTNYDKNILSPEKFNHESIQKLPYGSSTFVPVKI